MTGCVLAALVMGPTALGLAATWGNNGAYRHAWLVFPMFAYLLGWHYREEILADYPMPDARGVVVAVVAAIGWSAAAATNIDIGQQFALVLAIQGIALAALGRQLYWRLFPIMGLLFLMLPTGDLLLLPLRLLTVRVIELFALVAGLPHRIDGFTVFVGEHSYFVFDACAGLSQVTLTLFLGYCFGLLVSRSIVKVASVALLGGLLGIASNAIRVNAIIWLDWLAGTQMDLAAHARIQWIALALVLAALFLVLIRLKSENAPAPSMGAPPVQVLARASHLPVAAGLGVLAICGVVTLLLDEPSAPSRAQTAAVLPKTILGWELASPSTVWAGDSLSGVESLTSDYRRNGQELRVTVIEAPSPRSKLHESQLVPRAHQSWRDVRSEKLSSCVAAKCLRFVHTIWERDLSPVVRHVYYSYSVGGFQTDSTLLSRLATAWLRLLGRRNAPRLIGFSVDGDPPPLDQLVVAQQSIEAALASDFE